MTEPANPPPECPMCGHPLRLWEREPDRRIWHSDCRVCGRFAISRDATTALNEEPWKGTKHLLSGVTRNSSDRGAEPEITAANLGQLIDSARPPHSPLALLDALLLLIADRTHNFAEKTLIEWSDYSLFYLRSYLDLRFLWQKLADLRRIEPLETDSGSQLVRLTLDGWRRVEELEERRVRSRQAFVAMWFDPTTHDAWRIGFDPALRATGFDPLRIDVLEHNERIDDRIVAEIRRSGLLVADFTGHRGGVYFEAGLAMGLGLDIIWTCHKDQIEKAHFDTRQYSHVTWSTPEELRDKLVARIRATIPGAKLSDDAVASER